jgi:vacuolar-type H+-ATPase subunit F/Vma7
MAFKMRGFSGFKKTEDEEEIKDDIRFLPGDSDSDSSKPYDVDIIKQHILNRPRRRFKKSQEEIKFEKNRDRLT